MLIAVAGLAGVGKTTAVGYLESAGVGRPIYVGRYIQDEVKRRGLPINASNERFVRQQIRQQFGLDFIANKVTADLEQIRTNEPILLDAIYVREEAEHYRAVLGRRLIIIGIEADFELRVRRLATRADFPLTPVELVGRDAFDIGLGVREVVVTADMRLTNEGSLDDFKRSLDGLRERW